ncbi:MAG: hypothetical protein ACFN1F_07750 [Segatella sp.]
MTSLEMRGNALFTRNGFDIAGKWQIPVVESQEIDLDNIDLIAYSDIRSNDNAINKKKGVHFFIDDYSVSPLLKRP